MAAPVDNIRSLLDEIDAYGQDPNALSSGPTIEDRLRDAATLNPTQYNHANKTAPLNESPRFLAESPEFEADQKLKAQAALVEERPKLRRAFDASSDLPIAIGPERMRGVARAHDSLQQLPDPKTVRPDSASGFFDPVFATGQATVDQFQATLYQYRIGANSSLEISDALLGTEFGGARNRDSIRNDLRSLAENQATLEEAPIPGQMLALGIGQLPHLAMGISGRIAGRGVGALAGAPFGPQAMAAGGVTGTLIGGFTPMAMVEGGLFYADAMDSMPDVPNEDKAAMALVVGMVNGALELVPLESAVSTLTNKFRRDAGKLLADQTFRDYGMYALRRILTQAVAEGGTEFLQEVPGTLVPALRQYANGEIEFSAVVESIISSEFGERALKSAQMGAMGAPVVAGIGLGIGAVGFQGRVEEAQANREVFQKIADIAVDNSEIIQEMPERYHQLMEDALDEDGQIEGVYVAPDRILQAYEGDGAAELSTLQERIPGLRERISLAAETGGKVRFSPAEFATFVAPSARFAKIGDDLSFGEDQSSLREAFEMAKPETVERVRAQLSLLQDAMDVDIERDADLERDFVSNMSAIFAETLPAVAAPVREKNAELLGRIVMRIAEMDGSDPLETMTNLLDRVQFEQRRELDSPAEIARSEQALRAGGQVERLGQATTDVEQPFEIAGTRFDQREGIGATPNGANVNYLGFVTYMRPSEFLALNPVREAEPTMDMAEHIAQGGSIASPFLEVKWDGDSWAVVSHEGRGRMAALVALGRDEPIPVQMFGRGEYDRARRIEEWQTLSPVRSDRRADTPFSFIPTQSVLDRQTVSASARQSDVFQQAAPEMRVSTRVPTGAKIQEDPMGEERLSVSAKAVLKLDPKQAKKHADTIRPYTSLRPRENESDAALMNRLKKMAKDNLRWLWSQVPEATRERTRHWYVGANAIAQEWADQYGHSVEAVSGVMASLSPNQDWFINVSLAERVLDVFGNDQDHILTDEEINAAIERERKAKEQARKKPSEIEEAVNKLSASFDQIRGMRFADIEDNRLAAIFVRARSQAIHDPQYRIVSPEGIFGEVVMGAKKSKSVAWGSYTEIGNAVSILRNPSRENISASVGARHKVRSFYNNIVDPTNAEDVTIDTHAVAAALLKPLSGSALEVSHNFGTGAAGSKSTGIVGTYGIYADAYRELAQELGILPRELQSVTWEAARSLFTAGFKSQKANVEAVENVWVRYRAGKISAVKAREKINEIAGGFAEPESATAPDVGLAARTSFAEGVAGSRTLAGRGAERFAQRAGGDTGGRAAGILGRAREAETVAGAAGRADAGGVDRFRQAETLPGVESEKLPGLFINEESPGNFEGVFQRVQESGGIFRLRHRGNSAEEIERHFLQFFNLDDPVVGLAPVRVSDLTESALGEYSASRQTVSIARGLDPDTRRETVFHEQAHHAYMRLIPDDIKNRFERYYRKLDPGSDLKWWMSFHYPGEAIDDPAEAAAELYAKAYEQGELFLESTPQNPVEGEVVPIPKEAREVLDAIEGELGIVEKRIQRRVDKFLSESPEAQPVTRGQLVVDRQIQKMLLQLSEENVNESTLTHELFHLALELVLDASESLTAGPEIRQFRKQIFEFLGVETRDQIGREQHERWAESGEVYMASGEAPTAELRGLFRFFFQRFKQVYRAIREQLRFADPNNDFVPLFDRLLASEDEIRREANRDHVVVPMLAPELTQLLNRGEEEELRRRLAELNRSERAKLEATIAREDERIIKAQMGELKQQVRQEVYGRRVHKLALWLRTGRTEVGEPLRVFVAGSPVDDHKMNAELLDEAAGDVATRKALRGMSKREGGLSPDAVAAAAGYSTAEEMLVELLAMENSEQLISRMVQERAAALGLVKTPEQLREAASKKVDGQARDRLYAAQRRIAKRLRGQMPALDRVERARLQGEAAPTVADAQQRLADAQTALDQAIAEGVDPAGIEALQADVAAAQAGIDAAREARADQTQARREAKQARSKMPVQAIRAAAREIIGKTKFGDLKREVGRYKKLRSKASMTQTEAALNRDWDALEEAIDQEQMANALAEEGAKKLEEVRKWKRLIESFDKPKSRKRARLSKHANYEDQDGTTTNVMDVIDGLLGMVSFKNVSLRKLEQSASIALFAKKVEDSNGIVLPLPPWVEDLIDRPNYKSMTVSDLEDLYVGVKALEKFGMEIVQEKEGAEAAEYRAEIDEMRASLDEQKPVFWAGKTKLGESQRSKTAKFFGSAIGSQMSFESIADILDDLNPEGAFNRFFVQRFKAAAFEEQRLRKMVSERINKVWQKYTPAEQRNFYSKPIPISTLGESLTKNEILAISANMGNPHNRAALQDARAYGLSDAQLEEILSHVTDKDADYLEAVIAAVDLLWEPAAAAEREANGVTPPKVEAVPWQLPSGRIMKGGYWPLMFDPALAERSAEFQAQEIGKGLMPAGGGAAMTKVGAMKARKKTSGKLTVRTDFHAVLQKHVNAMSKDIAWRNTIVKADKQLRKLAPELKRVLGDQFYRHMRDYLKRQGTPLRNGDQGVPDYILKVARRSRHGLGLTVMAYRLTQAAIQVSGFATAVPRVGVSNMLWALSDVGATVWNWDRIKAYRELIPELANRAETFDRDAQQDMLRLQPLDVRRPIDSIETIQAFSAHVGYSLMGMIDTFSSTVVASAAMHQAMSGQVDGISANDLEAAVRYAGKIIDRTQGSGGSVHAPAMLDGGEMMKLLTPMMTYVNAQTQQAFVYAALGKRQFGDPTAPYSIVPGVPRDAARLATFWLWAYVIETVLSEGLRYILNGAMGPDEPDEEAFFDVLAARATMGPLAGMPIAREIDTMARGWKPSTPLSSLMQTSYNALFKPIMDVSAGKDYDGEKHVRAMATALSTFTGLPGKQLLDGVEVLTQESFGRGR